MIYKTDRIEREWERVCDPRLQFILRAADHYMAERHGSGLRITSLLHDPKLDGDLGRKSNTKHRLNGSTHKCEAADVNPEAEYASSWEEWRRVLKIWLRQVDGIDVVLHGKEANRHLHIEIEECRNACYQVALKSPMVKI